MSCSLHSIYYRASLLGGEMKWNGSAGESQSAASGSTRISLKQARGSGRADYSAEKIKHWLFTLASRILCAINFNWFTFFLRSLSFGLLITRAGLVARISHARVYGEKFTIFTFLSLRANQLTVLSCFIYFCSVDLRERDPKAAKRWSDDTVFSNRAYFLFDKLPGELAVQNVKDSDTGKINITIHWQSSTTECKFAQSHAESKLNSSSF